MLRRPPSSTPFPYPTLFRSIKSVTDKYRIPFIFKASYKKPNVPNWILKRKNTRPKPNYNPLTCMPVSAWKKKNFIKYNSLTISSYIVLKTVTIT